MSSPVKLLPRQVRDQAAAGDAAHAQLYPQEPPAEGDPPKVNTSADIPDLASAPPTAPPAPLTEEDYRQKYLSLQGKYDTELPALRSRVEGLQHVLANLDTTPPTITPIDPGTPDDDHDERMRVIREEFGDDFVDTVVRQAMRTIEPQFRELQDAVFHHNKSLQDTKVTAAQQARQDLYGYMSQNVPDWITINRSEEFAQWLRQPDVFSGEVRQTLLDNAFQASSGPRVAAFFLTFLREQTATGALPTAQTPPGYQPAPRPSLETFAAPGRAAPSAPVASASRGRIWTRAHIQEFYDLKRRGAYRNRQQEADQLELDIIAAGREGRVQG